MSENVAASRALKPNAETVAAIEAARRGETKSFNTVEELLADLNSSSFEAEILKRKRRKGEN
jgi:hypothetical protein